MSAIQTRSPIALGSPPEAATRPLLDMISVYANRLEDNPDHRGHKLLSARLAPPAHDRAEMEERRATLRGSLAPGDPKAMRPVVKALLGAFPTFGATADDADALAALTVRALDDVPVWAVKEAAAGFLKGRVRVIWDQQRAPTPPQIRGEAKHCMLWVEEEVARLSAVLDATLVDTEASADERAAAIAHWEKIKRGIQANNIVGSPKNLQQEALRESNDRFRLREHAELARVGETVPVAADGMTISRALLESNRRYAAERGISARPVETEDA